MHLRPYFSHKMSKKLKLHVLSSPRSLRSNNKTPDDTSSETSAYFKDKNALAPKETRKNRRSPVKIKYEVPEEKIEIKQEMTENVEIKTENVVEMKTENVKLVNVKTEDAKEEVIERDKWMPQNWEVLLENIGEMRKGRTAAVDEMGCHKCADPKASAKVSRFQSLVALMLSSQTKDQVTHAAMQRLNTYGCTPQLLSATPDDVLQKLIYPVGFYKRKVEYIKKTSVILMNKYNSDIPKTIKELCELPGVGPKMAHICMQIAWGVVSGIGVDTHVHRICNRIEWVKKPTKTPEETRMALEDWLPKDLWSEVNHLLVGFGQEICLPRFPKCGECLNKDICPFASKNGVKKKK